MKWNFVLLTSMAVASFSMSCLEQENEWASHPNITNGLSAKDDQYKAVVLLLANMDTGRRLCTGTFVSDSKLVTAAHCIPSKASNLWFVSKRHSDLETGDSAPKESASYQIEAQALGFKIHPNYINMVGDSDTGNPVGSHPHDLAVVGFPIGTSASYVRLASRKPDADEDVTLVGFGSDRAQEGDGLQFGGAIGVKRFGQSRLTGMDGELLISKGVIDQDQSGLGAGLWVATARGDSGCPMFFGGELVAITSGGGVEQTSRGTQVGVSRHVNLTNPSNAEFVRKALD